MIITISDPKAHVTASIDSVGAQLISLKDKTDKEYIWQRDPDIWPLLSFAVPGCGQLPKQPHLH